MLTLVAAPQNLTEAIRYFADADRAFTFMVQMRWPDGVYCPRCACTEATLIRTRRLWKCKGCKKQFSVKVGTIFEDSPLGLDRWLPALYLLANCKNGISSYELHRSLGVTQKTAWFMLHRIRLAMQSKTFERFNGDVEIDETFIGGVAKFMHKSRKRRTITGTGGMNKTAVVGALKRGPNGKSRIAASVVPNTRKHHLEGHIAKHVELGSNVYTDQSWSYRRLNGPYVHQVINHAIEYARGAVHTNGLENFWSLFKRTVKGTYTSIDPFHVHAYVDEQAFRFNEREGNDGDRFMNVLRGIIGKRLTYDGLIGADLDPATT
ncbi:MAG TPA: IS1595 family transposase [Gemmatimonadales bacterium]|jgi:transposase-like protein